LGDVISIAVEFATAGLKKGSDEIKQAVQSVGRTVDGIGKTLKRAVSQIIGVGSAFAIISKAVSTFMSQNEQLSQKMSAAWTALGNLLGPIITQIIEWVTSAISYFLAFLKLLGVTSKSASELSKSAKKGGGELAKTVAGFDELNKLQDNNGSGSQTLSDKEPTEFMKQIQELIAGKKWRELGQTIMGKVHEFLVGLPGKLSELIGQVDWKEIGNAIREFIKGIFDGIDIGEIILAWSDFFHNLWNAFLDFLWGLMSDDTENEPPIIKSLRELGDKVHALIEKIVEIWNTKLRPALEEIWHTYLEPIVNWLIEIGLPKIIDAIGFAVDRLAELLNGDINIFEFFFEVVGRVIGTFVDLIVNLLSKVDWDQLWSDFKKGLSDGWDKVVKWYEETFFEDGKFTMKKFFDGILDNLKNVATWIVENIFNPFIDGFLSAFGLNGTKGKLDEIGGQAIEDFFGGLKDKWHSVYEWAEKAVDKFLSIFKFDWKLPDLKLPHITVAWEPTGSFAQFFGVTALPHLGVEWYARGGIVDGATLIGAGENGKEAIVPLERNTEWINMVAKGLVDRLKANDMTFSKVGQNITALHDIADTVAFRMPALASGSVVPYSVSASGGVNSPNADNSEILRLLAELYEVLASIAEGMDDFQFVAYFDDLRALAKRITREQKRQQVAEGR